MKLLVVFLLVGHEVLGGPTVYSKTETRTPLNNNGKEEIKNTQAIDKPNVHQPYDKIAKAGNNKQTHFFSEENYEENPKRERETDNDYLKQFIKEILMYNEFKHLYLRDNDGRKIDYDENESADDKEPGIFKKRLKQALTFFKENYIKLSKILKNDYDKVERMSNVAKKLAKYLQHSKINENNNLDHSKQNIVNKETDMLKEDVVLQAGVSKDLVNRIILEIKQLLTTHEGNSQLYVSRILDIIRKNEDILIYHPDQACRESKMNYLIHGINKFYQIYLTNAECEGKYVDTGLDIIGWILLNRNDIKAERNTHPKYSNNDGINSSGKDEPNNAAEGKRFDSGSDNFSSETRFLNGLENKLNKKTKDVKRSLTSDDSFILKSKEVKCDEDNRDPNKQLLDLYIKSRLLRAWRSMIFHKSDPYYREIEKLFKKPKNADTGLDSIRLVCEKIASAQFLHSVEAIIWRLLHNTDCKPENVFKDVEEKNKIRPVFADLSKPQIDGYSSEESSGDDILDFDHRSDEGSLKYSTDFDNGGQSNEDSQYEQIPLKLKQFIVPISEISLKNKQKHLRDDTSVRNDHFANILNGLGKINSLKVIKHKLKETNLKDYKKLMDYLPNVEKVLKIIYKKFPPELQAVLDVLNTGGTKMIEDENFSLKKIPSLLMEAFSKGKGKDLFKMMADKFRKGKLKPPVTGFKKFRDETRLRNERNDSNLLVNQDKLQTSPEPVELDRLPLIEVPSGIEKTDQPIVELTYVINHPPKLYYKPKFFVKHNITYRQYLENIESIYNNDLRSTGNQMQLLKVVKKEGNESQVFYETDIPIAADENSKISNKSAMLKLYDQFYNSTKKNDRNISIVDKKDDTSNNEKERSIKVLKSISPTANDEIHTTDRTEFPKEHFKKTIKFKPKEGKEYTANNVSKIIEFRSKPNNSRSEEMIFHDANSVELDNKTKLEPRLSSEVYIGRMGNINWNQYPINRPKYKIKRKRSIKQRKVKGMRPKK